MHPCKCAKSVSYHKHENYVVTTTSVLTRMIVMKLWYFYGHTGIWPEPIGHQNLYISYVDVFMKQAKFCTMYLNLSAQKSLESRNQDKDHVHDTKYWEFFCSDHGNGLTLCKDYVWLPSRGLNFYRGNPLDSPKKLNIMKLSLSLSLPCEIFC